MIGRRGAAAGKGGNVDVEPHITLENVPAPALVIDGLGRVVRCNQRAAFLLERHSSLVRGMSVVELLGRDLLGTSGVTALPVTLPLPSGSRVKMIVSMSTLAESSGGGRAMVVLTPTRSEGPVEMVPRVAPWADVAERVATLNTETLCVAIGVTGLQSVDESFSRSTSDVVITEIARRLVSITPVGTIIERIAGNRFVIVAPAERTTSHTVSDIVSAVRRPIETPLGVAAVGCAVGITTGPACPPLILLDRADCNLTIALGRGVGTIEWNDLTRPQALSGRARLGAPLIASVAIGAISADFQPVVELTTGAVVEYEALARWQDERGDHHRADHFIGVAKETGVIGDLGTQVLQSALEFMAQLSRAEPPDVPRVSVNVSCTELADPTFAERVISLLTAASIRPGLLQFELGDAIGPLQKEYVGLNMNSLRDAGVRFALDGFGGNSANLLSLRDFGIDIVKLDPALSLIASDGSRSTNMLRSVLGLAEQLGVDVVAKGIETVEQHELLVRIGCRYAQGYLYSPPRPVAELHLVYAVPAIVRKAASPKKTRRPYVSSGTTNGS